MVKLFIIDVDGTLTDGGIYYDEQGNELKKFCSKDAAAFFALRKVGIEIMVLTGRECHATKRRMEELKVDYLHQNVRDKVSFLRDYMKKHHLYASDVGYIGDDLNDLPPMKLCGYIGCPNDSCKEILERADYVSPFNGGQGAVRNIIENYLTLNGLWTKAVNEVYNIGI